jgi:hypothetical protein
MKKVSWTAIADMVLILLAAIFISMSVGCKDIQHPDPQMGPNAITLDEPNMQSSDRFEKVYSSLADRVKIEIYKDRNHEDCELIIVTKSSMEGTRLAIQYVDHDKRRYTR